MGRNTRIFSMGPKKNSYIRKSVPKSDPDAAYKENLRLQMIKFIAMTIPLEVFNSTQCITLDQVMSKARLSNYYVLEHGRLAHFDLIFSFLLIERKE